MWLWVLIVGSSRLQILSLKFRKIHRKTPAWWWIVFVVWLTDERRLALFPTWTIVKDPHHREFPKNHEQEPVQNLSTGFDEWSRPVVITITPTPHVFNFITKETLTHLFTCEFCEIFKRSFFTEHSKNLCLEHGAKIVLIVVRTKVRAGCTLVRSST